MPKPTNKSVVPKALATDYLKALRDAGGRDLEDAGRQVLADVRAGKKIKLPKGARIKKAPTPHLGALMVDPATVGIAACVLACLKLVNPYAIAGCVALCAGIGVPPV